MIKTGKRISMNADTMEIKAEELGSIAKSIAEEMEQIDESIQMIVDNGITGPAVEKMSKTYLTNRKIISSFVQDFAKMSIALSKNAEGMKEIDLKAQG